MTLKRKRKFEFPFAVVGCAMQALVLAVFIPSEARAQDVFSSGSAPDTGGNSGKTGTQGVAGNPFCPPPVIIIDGVPTTPRNWSCRGDEQSYRTTPDAPPADARPGLPGVSNSPNPCQPGGPGGYNFLDNPVGTALPPGCVRTTKRGSGTSETRTIYDPYYESLPQNAARTKPTPYGSADPGTDHPEQTQDYRKPPMPVGEISPGYEANDGGTRMDRDAIPTGMDSEGKSLPTDTTPLGESSSGYEANDGGTRIDREAIPTGMDSEGKSLPTDTTPLGESSPGYEANDGGTRIDRDAIPIGIDSEGKSLPTDTAPLGESSPGYEAEDQNNLKPPIPEERTSPDVGFSVKIYR